MSECLRLRRNRRERLQRGMKKLWGIKDYVHYLDCGDGFMEFTYIKTQQIVHFKYVQFITRQYLNKVVFKKRTAIYSCALAFKLLHFCFDYFINQGKPLLCCLDEDISCRLNLTPSLSPANLSLIGQQKTRKCSQKRAAFPRNP